MPPSANRAFPSFPAHRLRAGAFLVGMAFLALAAADFFIPYPALTPVQVLLRVLLVGNGLLLLAVTALPSARSTRLLRPALFVASASLGAVALGVSLLLLLSVLHSDGTAPFLLAFLAPAIALGVFAFLVWHNLRPSSLSHPRSAHHTPPEA